MLQTTYNNIKKAGFAYKSALKFIADMLDKGIPLSAIDVNDWTSSPSTIVGVTIPYGSPKNGGKSKTWKNKFGAAALKSAVDFWATRK